MEHFVCGHCARMVPPGLSLPQEHEIWGAGP
jgi:hypothetical protein